MTVALGFPSVDTHICSLRRIVDHQIEEMYWFPTLATKLPQFGSTHLEEHAAMHRELESFAASLKASRMALSRYKGNLPPEGGWPSSIWDQNAMKEALLRLEGELIPHLDAEEASLKADVLRNAGFKPEDLARLPHS